VVVVEVVVEWLGKGVWVQASRDRRSDCGRKGSWWTVGVRRERSRFVRWC